MTKRMYTDADLDALELLTKPSPEVVRRLVEDLRNERARVDRLLVAEQSARYIEQNAKALQAEARRDRSCLIGDKQRGHLTIRCDGYLGGPPQFLFARGPSPVKTNPTPPLILRNDNRARYAIRNRRERGLTQGEDE